MGFFELFVIAVSLSMDAFAVAVCKGLGMKKIDHRAALIIAAFFGVFQGIMPCIGYLLGSAFETVISPIDHWIVFILLGLIGANMIREALHDAKEAKADSAETLTCADCGDCANNAEIGDIEERATCKGKISSNETTRVKIDYKELFGLAIATSIDAMAVGITFAFLQTPLVFSAIVICVVTFVLSYCGVVLGHVVGSKFQTVASIAGGAALIIIGLKVLLEHLGVLTFTLF